MNGKTPARRESDISAVRQSSETNGNGSHPPAPISHHAPSPAGNNKKRKISSSQWAPQVDESDPEVEASSTSLAVNETRTEKDRLRSTSVTMDKLALEREKFQTEKEERSKESIRKDKELDLKIKASAREDLLLDLKIIQTNGNDLPDETSKTALTLIKAAVLKKYNDNPSGT
jgi:hypothetical protein